MSSNLAGCAIFSHIFGHLARSFFVLVALGMLAEALRKHRETWSSVLQREVRAMFERSARKLRDSFCPMLSVALHFFARGVGLRLGDERDSALRWRWDLVARGRSNWDNVCHALIDRREVAALVARLMHP
ncbi:MAG: hypothetical protein AB7K04_14470 [Pseudorhodoplanes sp.]